MKKLAKTFLTVSVVAFALSLTSPGSDIAWGVLTPLSAVLIIAFFIMNLLANEYAKYDQEQKEKLALAARQPVRSPALAESRPDLENKSLILVPAK